MGKVVEAILEKLQEGTELTADLLDIVLAGKSGYRHAAARSFRYGPRHFQHNWAEWYKERQTFYSLLNKLKREGLIVKKKKNSQTAWHITARGIKKLKDSRNTKRAPGGIPMRSYDGKNKSAGVTIIAYDIPEKIKSKRYWLRTNLYALNFAPLQKSVWIGTCGVPEEFLLDLRAQDLLAYVHILSVNSKGTLKKSNN